MFGGGFGNSLPAANAGGNEGADLEELETDHLALQAAEINSGDRLKFFSEPWPADKLPPPTASLLSIASQKGLVAAAGPSTLVVASTDKLRAAYIARRRKKDATNGLAEDEPKIKLLEAEVSISIPRVSHVAFSADESCLVIAAEEGGGLAVYDTNALKEGGREPVFQLSTDGTSVRHVLPNPSLDPSLGYLFGVVLTNGQFVLADLKTRALVKNANGSPVLHDKVVCGAWSKFGKQIALGLEDGSAVQIDREGVIKGQIPAPPQLNSLRKDNYPNAKALPLCSIAWLANFELLFIYTPFNPPLGDGDYCATDSAYFIVQKATKDQPYTYHRLVSDPCSAFVPERTPAHHFIARLNNWEPGLTDALIVGSSAAIDIGIFAKFKDTNQFVTATVRDESRRATMPLSYVDNASDTTPVGIAYDFSVQELAPRPIPTESDVVPDSRSPLPALYVMNTDGVLGVWWVIYDDAIRARETYAFMTRKDGPYRTYDFYSQTENGVAGNALQPQTASTTTSLFSSSESAHSSPAPQAQQPAFGKPAFGTPSTPSAFGSVGLGKQASVWGTPGSAASPAAAAPAFGKPAFGSSTPAAAAPAFGKSSFGSATPVAPKPAFGLPAFGQPAFGSATPVGASAFGQPSGIGANKSPWAAAQPASNTSEQSSGFSKFGSGAAPSGFAAFAGGNAPSPFSAAGQQNQPSPFASAASPTPASPFSAFGQPSKPSAFGSAAANGSASPFAAASQQAANKSSPFGTGAPLGQSTMFGAPTKQDTPSPFAQPTPSATTATPSSGFAFGQPSALGSGSASFASKPAESKEETMDEDADMASKPATPGGVMGTSGGFKLGSTFTGDGSAKDDLPKPVNAGASFFGNAFGSALGATSEKKSEEPKPTSAPVTAIKQEPKPTPAPATVVKPEPGTEDGPQLKDIPEAPKVQPPPAAVPKGIPEDAPLPPDPTTFKTPKIADDMPLPPDPTTYKTAKLPDDLPLPPDPTTTKTAKVPNDLPLPPDPSAAKPAPHPFAKPSIFASKPTAEGAAKYPTNPFAPKPSTQSKGKADEEPPALSDEDEEDEDWDDEDEEDEDGDGDEEDEEGEDDEDDEGEEDEDDEEVEEDEPPQSKAASRAGLEAFKQRITPASPKSAKKSASTTPKSAFKTSYTPTGLPKTLAKGPVFAPPAPRPQLIPRSPSPVRAVTSPMVGPGTSSDAQHPQMKAVAVPPAKPIERRPAPPPQEVDEGELQDRDDDRIRVILASQPEPIKNLESFLTHQEYTGKVEKPGIPGQIERVYRDINAMVDVAGLNARHIGAFVAGQSSLRKPGARTVEDLEDLDAWVLEDLKDIPSVVNALEKQLNDGRLTDPNSTIAHAKAHEQELLKLKHRTTEIRRTLAAHTDPERLAAQEAAPLNAETQAQQAELRQRVQEVQKLLAEVEEQLSLLRVDLASAAAKAAESGSAPASGNVPTVEAVINTILKMTAMVEQRSGDIDVLEAQMRRLPQGMAALTLRDDQDDIVSKMRASRLSFHGSPVATPPRRRAANGDALGMSGMFGLNSSRFRTPPSASVLGRSSMFMSPSESARKKMADVTAQEVAEWQRKSDRRHVVLQALERHVLDRPAARRLRIE